MNDSDNAIDLSANVENAPRFDFEVSGKIARVHAAFDDARVSVNTPHAPDATLPMRDRAPDIVGLTDDLEKLLSVASGLVDNDPLGRHLRKDAYSSRVVDLNSTVPQAAHRCEGDFGRLSDLVAAYKSGEGTPGAKAGDKFLCNQ